MGRRKPTFQALVQAVRELPAEVILNAARVCDGHTIFHPQKFIDAGLPEAVVCHLTVVQKSDGTPKGNIYVNGQAVRSLRGVYGLDVLKFLAHALDVKYREAMGRGFQAQNVYAALEAHLKSATPTDPKPAA